MAREPRPPSDPREEVTELDLEGETDLERAAEEALAAVEKGGGRDAPAAASVESAEDEVARLEREIADLRDRSIRTLADFDNFRKRSERDREELRRHAAADVLADLLGVMDNLTLALMADGPAEELKRGVELILRQMEDLLHRHGVRPVKAVGEPFDPAAHEAVSRHEDASVGQPTVVEELRRGYLFRDRLLRPASVGVAVPPAGGEPPPDA